MPIQKSLFPTHGLLTPRKGAWYEQDGRSILDLSGQTLNLSFGQPPSEVRQEVINEINSNVFFSSRFGSARFLELADVLVGLAPPNIQAVNHKLTDGSDAVETALKLGRQNARSKTVICLRNAWHGETMSTLNLSDRLRSMYVGGEITVRYSRGTDLEALLEEVAAAPRPATVIVDPVGFSTGLFEPSTIQKNLRDLRTLCLDGGHFLIFDEIQTFGGFLNGDFFSYDMFGVESDAIAIGKALGQGFPISACLYTQEAAELLYNEAEFTFGGQPPACAAALSGIRYVKNTLPDIRHSLARWTNYCAQMTELVSGFAHTKQLGFMAAITPFGDFKCAQVEEIFSQLFARGLICRKGNAGASVMLKAPLNFDDEMCAWALEALSGIDRRCSFALARVPDNSENAAVHVPKISGVGLRTRSLLQRVEIMHKLRALGIPVPEVRLEECSLEVVNPRGTPLSETGVKSGVGAKTVLTQVVDYILRAHANDILLGNRLPVNTLWDGVTVTFTDFSNTYVGKIPRCKLFEHVFALFHHACLIPAPGRAQLLRPFLLELLDYKDRGLPGVVEELGRSHLKFLLLEGQSEDVATCRAVLSEFQSILGGGNTTIGGAFVRNHQLHDQRGVVHAGFFGASIS